MQTNQKRQRNRTHEGAPAAFLKQEDQLRRSVMTCMLWEQTFYESGEDIATRIYRLSTECDRHTVADIAVEARNLHGIRHAPLVMLSALAKGAGGSSLVSETIPKVVRRADELAELLAVHAVLQGTTPGGIKSVLSNQMKKGLAAAFRNFDAYQLAKYNSAKAIKLRDVLFLCHPKPKDDVQAQVWKKLVDGTLESPDTWEVNLSAGANKKATFERLISEGKLGYMALIRNLRNMVQVDVDHQLMVDAIKARKGAHGIEPFRFVAAARACPEMEPALDEALMSQLKESDAWPGLTVILVDISGSMYFEKVSKHSDMRRVDAACALATVLPVRRDNKIVYSFSDSIARVPSRDGMAMIDAIEKSQWSGGTNLGNAVSTVTQKHPDADRLIVITDEQSRDNVKNSTIKNAYMLNVAPYENGVGYEHGWTRINGWSEAVVKYISHVEGMASEAA